MPVPVASVNEASCPPAALPLVVPRSCAASSRYPLPPLAIATTSFEGVAPGTVMTIGLVDPRSAVVLVEAAPVGRVEEVRLRPHSGDPDDLLAVGVGGGAALSGT